MANFGANPSSGFQFGAAAPPAGAGLFGSKPATTQPTGLFGAQPAPTSQGTGFSFGAPASTAAAPTLFGTPTATATPNLFGAPASTASTPGFSFGAPAATTSASGLAFGQQQKPLFGAATSSTPSLTFGTQTSTAGTGFQLGGATSAPGSTFGGLTTTTPSTGFNLGGGSTFGAPTTSTGLSFGLGASSTAPTIGLNFGATTAGSLGNFGLGSSTSTTPAFGLGGTALKPPENPAPVGLGGIATSQAQKPGILKNKGQTDVSPKDQPLPNEIMQSVEEFKKYVKQQKTYCSEICRFSVKEFKKVEEDIDTANGLINEVEKQLQLNRQVAEKLKHDTAKALQHIEMAQRTFDTPPGLQFDNTAPLQFFLELADNFEREMQFLKTQIENTDKYLKNVGKPEALTPQDLALGMRRLHETFVALAGRLQSVHNQVEQQKEQYLSLRKFMLHDNTNVFDKLSKDDKMNVVVTTLDYKPPAVVTGPTPFNPLTNPNVAAHSLQATQLAQSSLTGPTPGMGSTAPPAAFGLGLPGSSNSPSNRYYPLFYGSSLSSGFQLQKPPAGNKRSK